MEAFSVWLKQQSPRVLPKRAFGQAINYCRNQWDKLEAFLQDGRLELDNNRSERSVKTCVIGRKNWLFANTPRGAQASATIYSIVETAKENGLNPFSYLQYLFWIIWSKLSHRSGKREPRVREIRATIPAREPPKLFSVECIYALSTKVV